MHDEAHDCLEVVTMEGDLRLLGHVHPAGVPGPLAVPDPLQTLAAIGRLEELRTVGEAREEVGRLNREEGGRDGERDDGRE